MSETSFTRLDYGIILATEYTDKEHHHIYHVLADVSGKRQVPEDWKEQPNTTNVGAALDVLVAVVSGDPYQTGFQVLSSRVDGGDYHVEVWVP